MSYFCDVLVDSRHLNVYLSNVQTISATEIFIGFLLIHLLNFWFSTNLQIDENVKKYSLPLYMDQSIHKNFVVVSKHFYTHI